MSGVAAALALIPGHVIEGVRDALCAGRVRERTINGGFRVLGSVPDRARGDTDDPLESMTEGRLRAVAELGGELADGGRALLQACQREMHAPAGEVLHGRLTDQLGEAGREG